MAEAPSLSTRGVQAEDVAKEKAEAAQRRRDRTARVCLKTVHNIDQTS